MDDPKPKDNITVEGSGVSESDSKVGGSTPTTEATPEQSLNQTQEAEKSDNSTTEFSTTSSSSANIASVSFTFLIASLLVIFA